MQAIESQSAFNPFAQMGNPDAVAEALTRAKSWNLKSRVCHPLDRPSRKHLTRELAQFDALVDAEAARTEINGD